MTPRIAALGAVTALLLLAAPLVAALQAMATSPSVAILAHDRVPAYELAFREGLQGHGYVEGKNIRIDVRYLGDGGRDRLDAAAAEILALKPDVIVTTSASAAAFKRVVTPAPPVVFVAVADPVGVGLADSLARPGGNFTGLSYQGAELNAKRLELLTEALPRVKRIGVLGTRTHPLFERARRDVERAGEALKVQLDIVAVADGHPEDIDAAFNTLTQRGVGALLGLQGRMLYLERKRTIELASRHRLPGMFELTEFAELGGFMAYSASVPDLFRRASGYVAKILRGEKPGVLPIEQPTKFELVINATAAKALGVTIPPSLLLRTDHVIR